MSCYAARCHSLLPASSPDSLCFRGKEFTPELRIVHYFVLVFVIVVRVVSASGIFDDAEKGFSIVTEIQDVRTIPGSIFIPVLYVSFPRMVLSEMPAIASLVKPLFPVVIPSFAHLVLYSNYSSLRHNAWLQRRGANRSKRRRRKTMKGMLSPRTLQAIVMLRR